MAASFVAFIFLTVSFYQTNSFIYNSGFCGYFAKVNCSHHGSGSLCGSNGVTYVNHCEFTKDHCTNTALTIKRTGPCHDERMKQDLVLSLVCQDILAMDCDNYQGYSAYCGTDGRSYRNVCHFEKSRCHNNRLFLNHLGNCRNEDGNFQSADADDENSFFEEEYIKIIT